VRKGEFAEEGKMKIGLLARATLRLVAVVALASAFGKPQQAAPTIRWSPIVESSSVDTNQIFPAEILALANRRVERLPARYLGDPNGVLGVRIVSSTPDTHIRISIKVDRLAEETSFETTIPEANQEYEIWPTVRFDTRVLARIREAFPTTVVFSASANGVPLGEQAQTIQVRSVNDVPVLHRTRDGQVRDLSYLFAAFVDENHPWVDGVLAEALKSQAIRQFIGYQGSPQDVVHQVFAIWNALQRRQVRYSSITRPSGQSEAIMSQHVRFLDETIRASQANCVDGSVLFASIIYKLEMCPVLVLIPGHMFLGVYLDRQSCGQRRNLMFLETTVIGNPGLNVLQRQWKFLNPDSSYTSSESYRQFLRALDAGNREFQSVVNSINSHQPGYQVVSRILWKSR
jgi:hypothetical protein